MGMVIVLAVCAVSAVGGMAALKEQARTPSTWRARPRAAAARSCPSLPDLGSAWMPMLTFFVYVAVNWWATWYPGAEPGGGGFVAQRIFCAKDEKHSLLATLWFNVAHYAVRPWPWILTALASLVLYPDLADKESGFVRTIVDPAVFPVALRGLMVAAFAAAYMSTIGTQLNWGASLPGERFLPALPRPRRDRAALRARLAGGDRAAHAGLVRRDLYQESIAGAWKFLIAVGAGTGSVFILRWFWWRINAWSEVVGHGRLVRGVDRPAARAGAAQRATRASSPGSC